MESKLFIHKETGEYKIQIPIMELKNYREVVGQEKKCVNLHCLGCGERFFLNSSAIYQDDDGKAYIYCPYCGNNKKVFL